MRIYVKLAIYMLICAAFLATSDVYNSIYPNVTPEYIVKGTNPENDQNSNLLTLLLIGIIVFFKELKTLVKN